jgi:putative tricarboxylic transport membrane protein
MLAGLVLSLAMSACGGVGDRVADGAEGYPARRLDWTIAFGPGGGNDRMARTLIDILGTHELYTHPIVATNRPAGSGAQGWGYLFTRPGDAYQISTVSGSFVTLPLQADVPWRPEDFTPVALLASDDMVLAVPRASEITTFSDFLARAGEGAVTVGGVGSLGVDFMIVHRLGELAGFEPLYVAFNEMGSLVTAALSRSLDALVANPGEALGLLQSGELRPLAFTGRETPDWLGDVPTFAELGYAEAAIQMPRGVVLPPGVAPEVRDWWIETLRRAVETTEWEAFLEENLLSRDERWGDDFGAHLQQLSATLEAVYRDLGVLRR